MAIPLRALIVEDNKNDELLLLITLRNGGFSPDVFRVDTKAALEVALKDKWDIVFSDFTMPSFNGHEALSMVRKADPDIPFFFVSGTIGEDRAVEAMRLGAQDYFIKGNLKRLPSAINRELREVTARRKHRVAEEHIHYLANYDALTGLPNRLQFEQHLSQCLHKAAGGNVAVFAVNLKRFRDVNDLLGMAAGDALLRQISRRLGEALKEDDFVARLVADEFAICSSDFGGLADIKRLAKTILEVFSAPFLLSRYEWRIQANVGVSIYPDDADNGSALYECAAIALHDAQQKVGSNYVGYAPKLRANLQSKLDLARGLEAALDRQEFQLHYQAQVDCSSGRLVGVEALLRWQHPGGSFISPADFIPLAEESGLIVPIGAWVLRESCRQVQQWRMQGHNDIRVAVNFSAFQFRQPNLAQMVAGVLQEFDLPAHVLEVEITETVLMHEANSMLQIINELHDVGVSIALDDFGTGYSSLSYLKRFPVDILKIDRAFVSDLPGDSEDAAIVHAIIAIAEKLHMKVIAEGVETAEQKEFLKAAGCDLLQGYFIQRPVPANEVTFFKSKSS